MDDKQLQALANELAKNLKTPEDLSQFDRLLKKISVEAALNAELTHHLGHEKNQPKSGTNSRNGYSTKTVTTTDGPMELRTPRDRDGSFEPQLVKKNQTRITGMDNQILALYARGMTTREITSVFKEMYDADVSPALISKVTDAAIDQVVEWQNRPLDAIYPIVYLECIVLKVRQDSRVINRAVFLALGINLDGQKELPGMWLAENEGAKFWLNVLTELKNRGLNDILIACVDGLKGLQDLKIVHNPRSSMWRKAMVYLLQGIFYTPLKYPDHKSVRLAADIFPIQSTCQPAPIVLLSALAFAHRSSLLVVLRQSRPSTFDNKLSLHFSQGTHHMKEKTPYRRAGINSIRQAAKINATFAQLLNQNDQMPHTTPQPIQLPDNQSVTCR